MAMYFTIQELTHSQMATRYGLDNTPPESVVANLDRLMDTLDHVRESIRARVIVTSGYRSPRVNRLIGGSATSAHMDGRAADIIAPRFGTPFELARFLRNLPSLHYDQLIYEGDWVHLGIARAGEVPRQEVLTAVFEGGHVWYRKGIET